MEVPEQLLPANIGSLCSNVRKFVRGFFYEIWIVRSWDSPFGSYVRRRCCEDL